MILVLHRASIPVSAHSALMAQIRDVVYPTLARNKAVRSFQSGIRDLGGGRLEFVLASTWVDFASLMTELGAELRPAWVRAIPQADSVTADHYEIVGAELRGLIPLSGGVLRIVAGELRPNSEPSYFAHAREEQQRTLDDGLVIATHIGRRVDGPRTEAASVDVWRDRDALLEWQASEPGGTLPPSDVYFDAPEAHEYDALVQVTPRADNVPALLLADDERRYVFATPAAARLLQWPVGRLLGAKIEDATAPDLRADVPAMWATFLATGSQDGPYRLTRRDGSAIELLYSARTNTPWPGVHVSLLTEPDQPLDLNDALAAAGLVGHYTTPPDPAPAGSSAEPAELS
ncbi:hypothetical protein BH23CHL7_BH23CHL7_08090 [soil metagenome]